MSITYHISKQDHLNANLLHAKNSSATLFLIVLLLFIIINIIFDYPFDRWIMVGGLLGLIVSLLLAKFFIFPWQTKTQYKKHRTLQEQISIQIKDDGLQLDTENTTSLTRWKNFYAYKQNQQYFLIYLAPRLMYIVPKRIKNDGFDFVALQQYLDNNRVKKL